MKTVHLIRFTTGAQGTLGRMGSYTTLELPWVGNRPNISCIPAGTYVCKRTFFNHGGYDSYEVQDVPGRTGIFMHSAAAHEDLEGCIGVGDGFAVFNNLHGYPEIGITNGRTAIRNFLYSHKDEPEIQLIIEWYSPPDD